jgi:hypothetical protein
MNKHPSYHGGRKALPYLLSTTKTLARCELYYYDSYDFHFNCRKNREYESDKHCRTNITRVWHNIIIPNAIIARDSGHPSTINDALTALDYAMRNGKSQCAIDAYKRVLEEESAKPEEERIWYSLNQSFYYYGLGMAAVKDKTLIYLPKSKRCTLKAYIDRIRKFKRSLDKMWVCPWTDLNRIIYACKHWEDDYRAKFDALNAKVNELCREYVVYRSGSPTIIEADDVDTFRGIFGQKPSDAEHTEILQAIADRDACEAPPFPRTYDEFVKQFGVSTVTVRRYKMFLKQLYQRNSDAYWELTAHNSTDVYLWQYEKTQSKSKPTLAEKVAEDVETSLDTEQDFVSIDFDIQAAQNSGNRPEGNWTVESPECV